MENLQEEFQNLLEKIKDKQIDSFVMKYKRYAHNESKPWNVEISADSMIYESSAKTPELALLIALRELE